MIFVSADIDRAASDARVIGEVGRIGHIRILAGIDARRVGLEMKVAVRKGAREAAKKGRELCRYNFAFGKSWQGKQYAIKQVAPVIKEEAQVIIVITVYTFYF